MEGGREGGRTSTYHLGQHKPINGSNIEAGAPLFFPSQEKEGWGEGWRDGGTEGRRTATYRIDQGNLMSEGHGARAMSLFPMS
jgi:hypothetical protein